MRIVPALAALLAAFAPAASQPARADTPRLRIGARYGTSMPAAMPMKRDHLVQKHPAAAGLGPVEVGDRNIGVITGPGQSYGERPRSAEQFARFTHGIGLPKTAPARWHDALFQDVAK